MNHSPLYLSRDDHAKLRRLLATSLHFPGGLALRKLREELDRATVIDPLALPDDVVAMDSTVAFEDLGSGETEEYTIVFPEEADVARNRISILAPIGTALIGCRAGDIVRWPTPGGIRKLKIRRVSAPAVEAGGAPALLAATL